MYVITGYRVIPSIMRILTILQQMKGSKITVDILHSEFEQKTHKTKFKFKDSNFTFKRNINISNISFSYEEGKKLKKFFNNN